MNNEVYVVIFTYGFLGAVAWVLFTRSWSTVWRMSPPVGLALIWLVITFDTTQDNRYDPDLLIRPSSLAISDAALWSLPLALAVWMPLLGLALAIRKLFRSRA